MYIVTQRCHFLFGMFLLVPDTLSVNVQILAHIVKDDNIAEIARVAPLRGWKIHRQPHLRLDSCPLKQIWALSVTHRPSNGTKDAEGLLCFGHD